MATYRGQIGRNAAIPHTLVSNIHCQAGDVLVGESTAPIWGYLSELERTMILGKPSDEQKRMFEHMLALQTLAMEALEPGKPCSAIDQEVRAYFNAHDLMPYWKHHSGHTIGLRYHEGPLKEEGEKKKKKKGKVKREEKGKYVREIGGKRKTDKEDETEKGEEKNK